MAKYGEHKGIKDALNKAMVTSCPITYRNQTRMLKSSFIRICLEKKRLKVAGWTSGHHGYELMHPQCKNCVTGELIAAGKDFPQPAYTEWIEVGECKVAIEPPREPALLADMIPALARAGLISKKKKETKMAEITWKKEWSEVLHEIPPAKLCNICPGGLKRYWKEEILPQKSIGKCVNCTRETNIRFGGLCGSCEKAGAA